MRHLHQNPGPVSGGFIAPAGAPVGQVAQNLEGVLNDGMGSFTLQVADHAYAAGIMLEARIIQPLGMRMKRGWVCVGSIFHEMDICPSGYGFANGYNVLYTNNNHANNGEIAFIKIKA